MDRVAEIEAIFQDLEERRLQALYEGDKEAFKSLFANKEYMQRSLGAFEAVDFVREPEVVLVEVVRVIHDGQVCIAAEVRVDATQSLGSAAIAPARYIAGYSDLAIVTSGGCVTRPFSI